MLSVLWLALGSLLRIFRSPEDLIFEISCCDSS